MLARLYRRRFRGGVLDIDWSQVTVSDDTLLDNLESRTPMALLTLHAVGAVLFPLAKEHYLVKFRFLITWRGEMRGKRGKFLCGSTDRIMPHLKRYFGTAPKSAR